MRALKRQTPVTLDEYLKFEDMAPDRHEYVGGIYAMVGSRLRHIMITRALVIALTGRLKGTPCQVFFSEAKVRLDIADCVYYPDVVVTCVPQDGSATVVRAPRVIVEVLSDGNASTDRREKLPNYQAEPTIEEIVLLAQDVRRAEVFRRTARGWVETVVEGDGDLDLDSLGLSIPLREVYEG